MKSKAHPKPKKQDPARKKNEFDAVIFDIDNTLMDFMRMKRAAVDAAVDAMIDAGLAIPKAEMVEKIF